MIHLYKIITSFDDSTEEASENKFKCCHFSSVGEMINFIHKATGFLFFEESLEIKIIGLPGNQHCLSADDVLEDDACTIRCRIEFSVS